MKREKSEPQAQPVMAFLQFQSMNGVIKFQQAMNHNKLWRFWMIFSCRKEQIEHKYLNAEIWPSICVAPEPSAIIW